MTQVLDLHTTTDPRDLVRRALEVLAQGQLVAFPTETVYGVAASALVPEAVERLRKGKGRPEGKPLTLAISGSSQALDWVPDMSPLGRRLASRCWPGPVTLVFPANNDRGLTTRLSERVRQQICPAGTLGLRVPAHEILLQALRRLEGPLVLTSANRSGEPAATTAEQVMQALGDDLAVVIDDGPSRYGKASTVVQVNGNTWEVLREGVVSEAELKRQAAKLLVFVCTGNTCRSPMAEGLCKKLLAERLGCALEELPERGFVVLSAGLAAIMGGLAAPEALEAARELDVDLRGHSSRPLTPKLVAQADLVIAMTRSHILALNSHFPGLGSRLRLLSPDGDDLADPVGCDLDVYRQCARQISDYLQRILPELQE